MCFQCHDPALVLKLDGTGLTRFRDGGRNLDFLHVNKETGEPPCVPRGPCLQAALPDPRGGSFRRNNWMLKISFKQTPTGGSCAPGCHKPKSYYDGANPRIPPATMPATTVPATQKVK